jgi:GTP cyclohydrolase I
MVNESSVNELGTTLLGSRQAAHRSLASVASDARISATYLRRLERGEVKTPSPRVLRAVGDSLGLSYDVLMRLAGYSSNGADGQGSEGSEATAGEGVGIDRARVERAVREILEAVGEDPDRDGLQQTPARVAAMYEEVLSGLADPPDQHLSVTFSAEHDEMVMLRDIPLYSLCEHHLTPFLGKAHVAYIPNQNGRITGLSKLARLVDSYSRRLQVQERLTTQIADEIDRSLEPRGVLVVLEAEHLCMSMRGVQKPGTVTVTSAVRGAFRTHAATRAEAMQFIHSSR